MTKLELYKYCPYCKKDERVEEKEPKTVKVGTDGYGQPVRYSDCECGEVYGWFNIYFYSRGDEDFKFTDDFRKYLQWRIKYYLGLEDGDE